MAEAAKSIECDVLIIGAGGAGLRAAIEASDNGAKTVVVSKTLLGKSHTVMAEGGINAALGNVDREDNWKIHFKDTMVEGQMLSNCRMAERLVKNAPGMVLELEKWGAVFDRTGDGKIDQRFFGAHTHKRACHTGDRIGLEILRTLQEQVICREVEVMQEVFVTSLLSHSGEVIGAVAVELKNGNFLVFSAKAVIMAGGGCGRLFKITTNSLEATGDGYALALKAGAELVDMEMIQFHPTAMVWPESAVGMLVTEGVRAEGGMLFNSLGQRFMQNYDAKRMELSARDIIARAIYTEIEQGRGTEHGGVWLDITHKSKSHILKKLPRMHDQFQSYAGVDICVEKMEVAPSAHYAMGGIRVNSENCMSTVKGLFAAGEVSGGVHGANRLGGNSLMDILVFGRLAGEQASEYAKKTALKKPLPEDIGREFRRITSFFGKSGSNPFALKKKIQNVMWEHVGIVRNEERLRQALEEILALRREAEKISVNGTLKYNNEWMAAIDVGNMLCLCEAIILAALERKESRGAHYREDYREKNDSVWLVNILYMLEKGKPKISMAKTLKPEGELKEILEGETSNE